MVSAAEILTAMAAALEQACPEAPTILIDRGNLGPDWPARILRWPLLLLRHLGGKELESGRITGQRQLLQVVIGERNLRPPLAETPVLASLGHRVRQALEDQDLGLAITPLICLSEGPVAAGTEYRCWGQTYQTVAYRARILVLVWQNDYGLTEELRLPLYYNTTTVEQFQEGTEWARALDGTLHGYLRPRKKQVSLELPHLTRVQKEALLRAKAGPGPITIYQAEQPEERLQVAWTGEETWREERPGVWSTRLILQEI